MKKLIFSILFFVISFTFFGQTTFNRVEDYFGTNGRSSNFMTNILKIEQSYYCEIDAYDTLSIPRMIIVKIDDFGNELDKLIYKDPRGRLGTYPNQGMVETSDSNIVICTNILYDSSHTWSGYLIKIDTNLDTLWTKVYDLPANLAGCATGTNTISVFTAIKETPDKGFIIAGNYYMYCVNNQTNQRGFLLKVDSLGNVEWWKVYNDVLHLYDIELADDGGYVMLNGYIYNQFTKLDSVGNIQWQIISDTYAGGWAVAGDIAPCGNNEFIVAKTFENSLGENGIHTYKINITNHQIIWDTTYNLFYNVQSVSLHQVLGVEVNQIGDIVVWATAHVVESKGKRGAILKLNSQGDSLWAKYIVTDSITLLWDDLQLNDLIITDDGGFMGVGYQWFGNSGQVMAWLFKTDANGVIGWEKMVTELAEVKVYPNPAYDYINIEFKSPTKGALDLTIYNSVGKMAKSYQLSENREQNRINISDLESGIYFCEITQNGEILGVQKIVIIK